MKIYISNVSVTVSLGRNAVSLTYSSNLNIGSSSTLPSSLTLTGGGLSGSGVVVGGSSRVSFVGLESLTVNNFGTALGVGSGGILDLPSTNSRTVSISGVKHCAVVGSGGAIIGNNINFTCDSPSGRVFSASDKGMILIQDSSATEDPIINVLGAVGETTLYVLRYGEISFAPNTACSVIDTNRNITADWFSMVQNGSGCAATGTVTNSNIISSDSRVN